MFVSALDNLDRHSPPMKNKKKITCNTFKYFTYKLLSVVRYLHLKPHMVYLFPDDSSPCLLKVHDKLQIPTTLRVTFYVY